MIVAADSGQAGPRASDCNILAIAGKEGIYRPARHLEQAVGTVERQGGDPAAYVRSHVRRLEDKVLHHLFSDGGYLEQS